MLAWLWLVLSVFLCIVNGLDGMAMIEEQQTFSLNETCQDRILRYNVDVAPFSSLDTFCVQEAEAETIAAQQLRSWLESMFVEVNLDEKTDEDLLMLSEAQNGITDDLDRFLHSLIDMLKMPSVIKGRNGKHF